MASAIQGAVARQKTSATDGGVSHSATSTERHTSAARQAGSAGTALLRGQAWPSITAKDKPSLLQPKGTRLMRLRAGRPEGTQRPSPPAEMPSVGAAETRFGHRVLVNHSTHKVISSRTLVPNPIITESGDVVGALTGHSRCRIAEYRIAGATGTAHCSRRHGPPHEDEQPNDPRRHLTSINTSHTRGHLPHWRLCWTQPHWHRPVPHSV